MTYPELTGTYGLFTRCGISETCGDSPRHIIIIIITFFVFLTRGYNDNTRTQAPRNTRARPHHRTAPRPFAHRMRTRFYPSSW
jgi:hypothetical protein